MSEDGTRGGTAFGAGRTPDLAASLSRLPKAAARATLLRTLCAEVASFLKLPPDAVDARVGFLELGFDSLRAVDFRARLEELLGCELRSTLLFDQPDCDRLTDFLLTQLGSAPAAPAPMPLAPADASAPIAIVGMACRFPGDAVDLESFWRLLDEGRSAIGEVPAGRWPIDELYDPDPARPGRVYTRLGGFLRDVEGFDAAFFGIPPVEAVMLDPQQRLLLEVAWRTLEHAGVTAERLHGHRPGVFIGMRASEYFQSQCARLPDDADAYYATGNAISTAAGRLSYWFGFRGPCFALDTACSGSLVAVHEAVQALRRGECRAALAGGVNLLIDPLSSVGLCRARMLAPDGRCKTFDAAADGYVRGEGCGLVLLMPVDEARALGLHVHAVIRGSAINQDGRTGGLTVPHGPSQEEVVRQALADARVLPDDVGYVEAHGTGTALGDPIEVGALDAVFAGRRARGHRLLVGSVKTNVGHLEAAAGISGLLKVVLALQHERLPAHRNFTTPNPHIAWDRTEIEVATAATAWPRSAHPRCAGVSSFGFSGTNAHVVVGDGDPRPAAPTAPARTPQAVALSAPTAEALRTLAGDWGNALQQQAPPLPDAAFTAARRATFAHRVAVVAPDAAGAARALLAFAGGGDPGPAAAAGHAARTAPRVAFLFSGQGAQRAGAGAELYANEPVFRAAIDRFARVFERLRERPLTEVLFGGDEALLLRTDYTQPALFALQMALVELWRSAGVVPAAVLGHSVGEIAAAAAAGVMSPEDGLRLCAARGALMVQHCRPGAMLAVFAPIADVRGLGPLPAETGFAAINGPAETVVSGDTAGIEALAARCAAAGVKTQRLRVSHAFHSPLMEPMLGPFERLLQRLPLAAPSVPVLACRRRGEGHVTEAVHWLRHIAEPVQFADAIGRAAAQADVLVEIGPSPVLLGLAARALASPLPSLPSLRRGTGERETWLRGLAALFARGAPVDFAATTIGDRPRLLPLPGQPFARRRFWLQQRAATARTRLHPLLGSELRHLQMTAGQRLFEAMWSAREPAFLGEHRVRERPLAPAAALFECALAAAAYAFGSGALQIADVAIAAPCWLDDGPETMQLLCDGGADGARFRLCRRNGDEWPEHASGTVRRLDAAAATLPAPAAADGDDAAADPASLYDDYLQHGLDYGRAFRVVRSLRRGPGSASGDVALGAEQAAEAGAFVVHPALLDGCFQIAGAALAGADAGTWLPLGVERLTVFERPGAAVSCRARQRAAAADRSRAIDLWLLDASGRVRVLVEGLLLVRADAGTLAAPPARLVHGVHWLRQARGAASPKPGARCIAAPAADDDARALAAALGADGGTVTAATLREIAAGAVPPAAHAVLDVRRASAADAGALADVLADVAAAVRTVASWTPPPLLTALTADAVAADVLDAPAAGVGAAVQGLLRTVAIEHPELRVRTVDCGPGVPVDEVVRELANGAGEDEVALRGEQRLCARLHQGQGPGRIALPPSPWQLRSRDYGRLDALAALPIDLPQPRAGEVLIEVAAAGLNFKDVLHALGLLQEWAEARGIRSAAEQPLGFECAGTVIATGEGVRGLAASDRVLASTDGAFASHVVAAAARTVRVPDGTGLAAAAALPTVFATALHALEHCAGLARGERVLVHAAAGGVGLAALQVCRRRGAEVFATSSAGKAAFLRAQGVRLWADSRTGDFAAAVRAAWPDGVDVVLNCLDGDAIRRSADLLRPGGRFVEIGKRGAWSPAEMAAHRPDVQYTRFDLADLAAADAELLPRLLRELAGGLADGSLRPLPVRCAEIALAPELFAAMAQGRHVGKLVLTMPRPPRIRDDRTYLVSGGTGGVGQAVARALVQRGARHVALLARGADATAAVAIDAAAVRTFAADVADREALAGALAAIRAEMPPLAGVVHAAGALADGLLRDLDRPALRRVLAPKVDGMQNLVALLDGAELDFLAAVSSMAAWFGNQGQAGYAAANRWLDAFGAGRAANGLAGSAIAFGPWAEAGMAARLAPREQRRLHDLGIEPLAPAPAAELLLDRAADHGPTGVFAVRWPVFARQFAATPSLLRDLGAAAAAKQPAASGDAAALRRELPALPPADRAARLFAFVRAELATVLGHADPAQLDAERTFGELGVDSLLAVELRTRIGSALALALPATLLFDHPDLDRLARHLAGLAAAAATAAPPAVPPAAAAELAALLEQQVRAMEQRP
jgi:acyl transferase domain-containing protein/NAD(P)-dependent dehydrogenase (short-subunit alcohol dehydrogenase family)/acyl carrier protein